MRIKQLRVITLMQMTEQTLVIDGLQVIDATSSIREFSTTRGDSIAMSITFTLEQSTIPVTLIDTVRRNTADRSSDLTSADVRVLAFQPNCKVFSI